MKIFNKNFSEYFKFSWKYILLVFMVGLIMVLAVELKIMSRLAYNPLSILVVLITFIAGWKSRKNKFNLKQAFIVGVLCSIGNLWLIPFSIMPYLEELKLPQNYFLINLFILSLINTSLTLLIYGALAIIGNWISSKRNIRRTLLQ